MVTHDIDDALVMADHVVVMGERPTPVKLDQRLAYDRARNLVKNKELAELRDEIYFMLGVSYAI